MEDRNQKVELLAPAGSREAFYGAVCGGADAVYLAGERFGARAYAENFTTEELLECVRLGHLLGKKLYLAVNTLLKEQELAELYEYLLPFYEAGMDAVIVQDMGVLRLVRERFPGWKIHGSTQMTVCSGYGASLLKEMGVCRVVPARELGLEELTAMKRQSGLEIEAFVHGAMCYCYSGQCLFSSILGGRSGNRGRCAQPCRLSYSVETQGAGLGECYPLSLKDLCTIERIPRLIEGGIDSFKIEGRMKKAEYAAGVTAIYRRYIDKYYELRREKGVRGAAEAYRVSPEDLETLRSLYIRTEVQDGYYFRRNGREMITLDRPSYRGSDETLLREIREKYLETWERMPVSVEAVLEEGRPAKVTLCWRGEPAGAGTGPQRKQAGAEAGPQREPAAAAKAGPQREPKGVEAGSQAESTGAKAGPQRKPAAAADAALAAVSEEQSAVTVSLAGEVVQRAVRQPVTEENVRKQLGRLGDSAFYADEMRVTLGDNVFYPLKQLNELRRAAVRELEEAVLSARGYGTGTAGNARGAAGGGALCVSGPGEQCGIQYFQGMKQGKPVTGKGWAVSVRTLSQLEAAAGWILDRNAGGVVRVYVDSDLIVTDEGAVLTQCRELSALCAVYVSLPFILRASDEGYLDRLWEITWESGIFSGFLARSMDGLGYVRGRGKEIPCRTDAGVYIWNTSAAEEMGVFSQGFCLPYELRASEQHSLLKGLSEWEALSCEKILYSRIPMMITANCLRRTAGQCGGGRSAPGAPDAGGRERSGCQTAQHSVRCGAPGGPGRGERNDGDSVGFEDGYHEMLRDRHHTELKDRHHAVLKDRYHAVLKDRYRRLFPVEIDCLHCMNIIYNSVPFSLHREISKWKGRMDLRVDFTLESAAETRRLLDAFPGGAAFPQMGETTSGHEKRGVE